MIPAASILDEGSGPVLVEGGHYTLNLEACPGAEAITLPGSGAAWAWTSPTTIQTFALGVREVVGLRARGVAAALGLLVGDLALARGRRPPGGAWALPGSYLQILGASGLDPAEVCVWGEAHARNQGKRRLLDIASRDAPATYAREGWALLQDGEHVRLLSEASLDWDGELRAAVLAKGHTPLCPLVFAGLAWAIARGGFRTHLAYYALPDDGWIDVKLRSAATAFAQLSPGEPGTQIHALVAEVGQSPIFRTLRREDLVGPGERPWAEFFAEVRSIYPDIQLMEVACPRPAPRS